MNIGAYRGCLAIGLAPCNSFNSFKWVSPKPQLQTYFS